MKHPVFGLGLALAFGILPASALAQSALPSEQAIAERYTAASTVTVQIERRVRGGLAGHGSGVVVSSNGLVVTARHVVADDGAAYVVVFPDGRRVPVRRVRRHPEHDLALLVTGTATPDHVRRRADAREGDWLVCAGFIASDAPTRSIGVLADADFEWIVYDGSRGFRPGPRRTIAGTLRTDCQGGRGMSGGPVIDLNGHLLGVIVAGGVAEPIEQLVEWAGSDLSLPMATRSAPAGAGRSRYEALESRFGTRERATRSTVLLQDDDMREFHGVAVSGAGHVVTVAEAVRGSGSGALRVAGQPDASLAQIIGVADELVLLRFDHLDAAPVDGEAARIDVGALVAAVPTGGRHWAFGTINGTQRRPGDVLPQIRLDGCGTMQHRRRMSNPRVHVGEVLSHDVGSVLSGSLLVDRDGRPGAIHVVNEAAGAGYAVPWAEVLRRFPRLARPSS